MRSFIEPEAAARQLGLHPSRVRALVAAGALPGEKVGGRWLLDPAGVAARARSKPHAGRPFAPHNAWALIVLASGGEAPWVSGSVRWRLRRALSLEGLEALAPRLSRRARAVRFRAHPGELSHLRSDARLVLGGASAAGPLKLPLAAAGELEGYVREGDVDGLVRDHALEPAALGEANVILRSVPAAAWHFGPRDACAPVAAVALDLAEAPDSRSLRIGNQLLRRLPAESGAR
jgi:hypothetical protein